MRCAASTFSAGRSHNRKWRDPLRGVQRALCRRKQYPRRFDPLTYGRSITFRDQQQCFRSGLPFSGVMALDSLVMCGARVRSRGYPQKRVRLLRRGQPGALAMLPDGKLRTSFQKSLDAAHASVWRPGKIWEAWWHRALSHHSFGSRRRLPPLGLLNKDFGPLTESTALLD